MMRKNPEAKADWKYEKVKSNARKQLEILELAYDMLKEGGTLAYSTCSFSFEEDEQTILSFKEKPRGDGALINGGFFVLSPKVIDLIAADDTIWELEPMVCLAKDGQLMAFEHTGFWQPMDTLREKNLLEDLWVLGKAPWKQW
jgi:glucose-1-phosphate cytidylyltransferase